MLAYNRNSKRNARRLRSQMTDAEQALWSHLRRKQILETRFYRQKPIGDFIVDFFAPRASLVVEVDGGQHWQEEHQEEDLRRDQALRDLAARGRSQAQARASRFLPDQGGKPQEYR